MRYHILSKQKLKYVMSLSANKFRQKYNKFVVEGQKLSLEFIQQKPLEIELIICSEKWAENHQDLLSSLGSIIHLASEQQINEISLQVTPQEPILIVEQFGLTELQHLPLDGWYLFLDRIQDPGNMGTIIRVAEWFGIKGVIRSKGTVEFYNPKVVQSSMGSIIRVPLITAEYSEIVQHFHGFNTFATVLEGEDLYQVTSANNKGIIIIGNESQGVLPDIIEQVSHKLTIPSSDSNMAESLNAAMATGIVCSFLCR